MSLEAGRKAGRESAIRELEKRIGVLRKDKMRLYESYAEGSLILNAYKKKREDIDAQINTLAEEQEKLKTAEDPEPLDSAACSFIEEAKKIAGEMEHVEHKELTRPIVEKILEEVYIYDANHMELKFRFEDAVKDIMERAVAE